jgi:hypothetical protein
MRALPTLLIVLSLIASCAKSETLNPTVESSRPNSSSPGQPSSVKPLSPLSDGHLKDIERLLLQVAQADQSSKDMAAGLLEDGEIEAEKDRQEGLHGGRNGLSKMFCASAMYYPTVDALIGCAEAISLEESGGLEGKVRSFEEATKIYQVALVFSDRTNTPISLTERQQIEENIACLDAFVKAPNPKTPGCKLVEISLTNPNFPSAQ